MATTVSFHLSLVASAVLCVMALPASAQSAAAAAPSASASASQAAQSVVVTGSSDRSHISDSAIGLDLTHRETPQAVTAISREEMDDFGLTSINDVLSVTPGVTVERVETDRTYYTSRGFDITNFQVDGIGLPFSNGAQWGTADTAFYERIDIVRGANGLLSPVGNPSATVNFIRKRPTREFEATVGVTLGSWNDRRVEGDVGGALTDSGTIRGRVIAFDEKSDSYLQRYRRDNKGFAALLDIDLAPRTTLELGFMQQDSDSHAPMWGALPLTYSDGTVASYDRSASTAADWSFWNNTDRRTTLELSHAFDDGWKATGTLTRRNSVSNSELFYVYGNEDSSTHSGALSYPASFGGSYGQTMADLRVSGPFELFGRQHSAVLGADWARENTYELSGYGTADTIGASLPDLNTWGGVFTKPDFDASFAGTKVHVLHRTVFGATHLSVTDALNLTLGANVTSVHSAGESYGVASAYSRTGATPYLGAVVDLSETTSAYASFTRIFSPQTQVNKASEPLMPIQGRNIEAGIKNEWFSKKLETSFAVFQAHQNGTAVEDADALSVATYHGENAVSTGFEAQVSGDVARGWNVNAGYTQMRIKGDDGSATNLYVPRRAVTVATSYKLPMLPALKVGGTYKWQSDTSTVDGTTTVTQGAYGLLGLMAHYDISPHWQAGVNVNNVTNRKYWTSLYWTQSYYGAPRNFDANLRWTF